MTTATEPTLQQALTVARRLSPRDRAQLITVLVQDLTETVEPASTTNQRAWDSVFQLMDEIAALPHHGSLSPLDDLTHGRR